MKLEDIPDKELDKDLTDSFKDIKETICSNGEYIQPSKKKPIIKAT